MGDAISKLFEQINTYEILNNIIPGTVFVAIVERLTSFSIRTENIWIDLVLFYFFGLSVGRIGSLILGKLIKKLKLVSFASYTEYIKAEQKDKRVQELSSINNMYRTYTSVGFCVLLAVGFDCFWRIIKGYAYSKTIVIVLGCIFLCALFAFSYVEQTRYVVKRIGTINSVNRRK